MQYVKPILVNVLILSLAGCGSSEDTASPTVVEAQTSSAMAPQMDHGQQAMGESLGHATGVVRAVGEQGSTLTIDHGPFKGDIKMDAMTMRYEVSDGVDISALTENTAVAFLVKHRRGGAYQIVALCNSETEGADCLADMIND